MRFEKAELADLTRCYAVADIVAGGAQLLLYASEGADQCISFAYPGFEQNTVWEQPGGTMSMVAIPGKDGEFLAVQKFLPTFNSAEAIIVWAKYDAQSKMWDVQKLVDLPYVHRFDILSAGGVNYFLGATLCTTKQFKEDWSDPGKLYAGVLPDAPGQGMELTVIQDGLVKNHGYTHAVIDGKHCGVVTCESGACVATPPQTPGGDWAVEQIMDWPVSDIALVDIDGDGEQEYVLIEPFHGGIFRIYKKHGKDYKVIYEYAKKMNFAHVAWGGTLCGKPAVIGGYRREGKELFAVTCENAKNMVFHTQTIDYGIGPSNVHVIHAGGRDIILSANRETGQAALYYVNE